MANKLTIARVLLIPVFSGLLYKRVDSGRPWYSLLPPHNTLDGISPARGN